MSSIFTDEQIESLRQIAEKDRGQPVDIFEAREMANNLYGLYKVVLGIFQRHPELLDQVTPIESDTEDNA